MKIRILYILISLTLALPVGAQKRKTARPVLSPEEQALLEKRQRMMATTQKVLFIDSLVVDKQDFFSHYMLSAETGSIRPGSTFFHDTRLKDCVAYLNEMGNKCFFSHHDNDSTSNLYYIEADNKDWSRPELVPGLNPDNQFRLVNYPYLTDDGETLFFAAVGDDGIGGYDIYETTYDEEARQFLRPVNIGMPFNSEADDYMYVIDEYNQLGWFATNRNQPEDKVCIYVFVPSHTRQIYSQEDYEPEEIESFSRIASIKDTWDDQQRYNEAIQRLHQLSASRQQQDPEHYFRFAINDDLVYRQLSDFKLKENQERYKQLSTLQNRQNTMSQQLDSSRDYYAAASADDRQKLADDITNQERELLLLQQRIKSIEKTIRNTENIFLTKNK